MRIRVAPSVSPSSSPLQRPSVSLSLSLSLSLSIPYQPTQPSRSGPDGNNAICTLARIYAAVSPLHLAGFRISFWLDSLLTRSEILQNLCSLSALFPPVRQSVPLRGQGVLAEPRSPRRIAVKRRDCCSFVPCGHSPSFALSPCPAAELRGGGRSVGRCTFAQQSPLPTAL